MRRMRTFAERFLYQFEKTGYKLHLCKMTGKLENFTALSTTCKCNPMCQEMQKHPEFICSRCYADVSADMYPALREWLESNYRILTESVLPMNELPLVSTLMCRIEAFGDLAPGEAGVIQAINYLNFCKRNKYCLIGWWTKHPGQIAKALERTGMKKPKNVQIVYSSPLINGKVEWEEIHEKFPFIDKVFTVYDKKYIEKNHVTVNCGGKNCFGCRLCYTKNNCHEIIEQLKKGKKPEVSAINENN